MNESTVEDVMEVSLGRERTRQGKQVWGLRCCVSYTLGARLSGHAPELRATRPCISPSKGKREAYGGALGHPAQDATGCALVT